VKTSIAGYFVQEIVVTAEQHRYECAGLAFGLGGRKIAEAVSKETYDELT
jgi:hypothetical protein